ncbi:16S rRNA processing protein RimM domain-containing protein [Toxoplasma gondii RUB]|uniref:16S rRNA processing protein RimM domain-containing protein n=1 Tax=Toxoplasma gondii RUB TaxID=935652 RepID=A0A086LUS8_TOXGO|nr:16S rRNA processing protein RimM domain-containing protein [Toxoplasma gondii RUB]
MALLLRSRTAAVQLSIFLLFSFVFFLPPLCLALQSTKFSAETHRPLRFRRHTRGFFHSTSCFLHSVQSSSAVSDRKAFLACRLLHPHHSLFCFASTPHLDPREHAVAVDPRLFVRSLVFSRNSRTGEIRPGFLKRQQLRRSLHACTEEDASSQESFFLPERRGRGREGGPETARGFAAPHTGTEKKISPRSRPPADWRALPGAAVPVPGSENCAGKPGEAEHVEAASLPHDGADPFRPFLRPHRARGSLVRADGIKPEFLLSGVVDVRQEGEEVSTGEEGGQMKSGGAETMQGSPEGDKKLPRHTMLLKSVESDWLSVGKVAGVHGLAGEVKVRATTYRVQERLCEPGRRVFYTPPGRGRLISLEIEWARRTAESRVFLMKFKNIGDRTSALSLNGGLLLISAHQARQDLPPGKVLVSDIAGFFVTVHGDPQRNKIGHIVRVIPKETTVRESVIPAADDSLEILLYPDVAAKPLLHDFAPPLRQLPAEIFGEKYLKRSKLEDRMEECGLEVLFQCEFCGKKFRQYDRANAHELRCMHTSSNSTLVADFEGRLLDRRREVLRDFVQQRQERLWRYGRASDSSDEEKPLLLLDEKGDSYSEAEAAVRTLGVGDPGERDFVWQTREELRKLEPSERKTDGEWWVDEGEEGTDWIEDDDERFAQVGDGTDRGDLLTLQNLVMGGSQAGRLSAAETDLDAPAGKKTFLLPLTFNQTVWDIDFATRSVAISAPPSLLD